LQALSARSSSAALDARPRFVASSPANLTYGLFDPAKPPVLEVDSGEVVVIDCLPSWLPSNKVPAPYTQLEDHRLAVATLPKGAGPHFVTGPIAVRGARPGDVLQVAIEDASFRQDWGWNGIWPGKGALPDRFAEESIRFMPFDLRRGTARLPGGSEIPLRPFFGILAVAPASERGPVSTVAPDAFGGNIDNRELIPGTSLFLPVWADGALFFAGDGHAAQGDGEVSQTALETALKGTFRLTLHKSVDWTLPRAVTSTDYMTMAFDPDLDVAVGIAVEQIVDWIVDLTAMTAEDAYSLFSFVGSLRVTQVVDGNKGVHAVIPRGFLEPGRASDDPVTQACRRVPRAES
jgi:acetamidase/formamidase